MYKLRFDEFENNLILKKKSKKQNIPAFNYSLKNFNHNLRTFEMEMLKKPSFLVYQNYTILAKKRSLYSEASYDTYFK